MVSSFQSMNLFHEDKNIHFFGLVLPIPINKSYLLPNAVFILHEERFHRIWISRFAYEKFVKFWNPCISLDFSKPHKKFRHRYTKSKFYAKLLNWTNVCYFILYGKHL